MLPGMVDIAVALIPNDTQHTAILSYRTSIKKKGGWSKKKTKSFSKRSKWLISSTSHAAMRGTKSTQNCSWTLKGVSSIND